MASPPDLRVVHEMGFAPLDPVDVRIGTMTVKLYPKITAAMPVHERAHAFQVNKSALKDLPADFRLVIDAFGAQLNASSTVEGILSDWRRYFQERWMNFNNLSILSFHTSNGDRIDTTTTAGDAAILLPVQNGNLPACRQQDVRFARVQCTLDFAHLTTVDPYPVATILRVSYYIELPQTSRAMTNGVGAAYTLVSFLGVDDIRTLSPEVMKSDILTPVHQDGPIMLAASDFNLTHANTETHAIAADIDGKILKMAWHQLCASIFTEICPGYSNQPQAALEHIRQSFIDSEGNQICTPVFAYYQRMMNAMRPFAGEAVFPKSVCNALIDGMDKRLMAIFRRNYSDHAVIHNQSASFQRSRFPMILQAMQSAEDEVQSISAIARSSVAGQAFHADVLAFPSQAERTLERYSSGGYQSEGGNSTGYNSDGGYKSDGGGKRKGRGLGAKDSCFGCGASGANAHPWMLGGKVVCPNADKPGIRKIAQENYEKWLAKKTERRATKKRKDDKAIDYDNLSDANKARMKEAVLASIQATTHQRVNVNQDGDAPGPRKKPMIFVADVVVLSSSNASRDILPAPIVSNFPHILLQFGTDLGCSNCPVVRCVLDTAAALSTGNFHFVAAIAKQYPHCVAKIYVPNDYNPIVLSGIVQRGGESITTELTVGFQFHLPYLTRDGDATSILIATGPHVTVNTIVGLPFIQATRAVIDLSDNVVELRAFDAPPFPLEYRRATVHVPVMEEGSEHQVHMAGAYDTLIDEINALEKHFLSATVIHATDEEDGSRSRHVTFGASPPRPTNIATTTLQSALAHATNLGKRGYVPDPMESYMEPDIGVADD